MSAKINKNEIYLMVSNESHAEIDNISGFMDKDFTISVTFKINKPIEYDGGYPHYIFSRNGRHSGIGYILTEDMKICGFLSYWFLDKSGESIHKTIQFELPSEREEMFNNYTVICNDNSKIMELYFNDSLAGVFNYNGLDKLTYSNKLIWIGAGSMIVDEDIYKNIADGEISFLLGSEKAQNIEEIGIIRDNYDNQEYIEYDTYKSLPILKNKEKYVIFNDFKYKNKYKIWNMINNGNFFQYYMPNNIYF